uniref:HAT C-terminal dimerisation domain-containing protein n=1 Tax=Amphimedon queenslandica TaxID=400682 RepID=A0A1X7VUQ7_AMPQE
MRFEVHNNIDVQKGIAACTPKLSNFLSIDDLTSFTEMHGVRPGNDLKTEVELVKRLSETSSMDILASFRCYRLSFKPAYSTLSKLAQIAMKIAVTSSESEHSFSALKRIKLV